MKDQKKKSQFSATPLRPKNPGDDNAWAFVVLPQEASATLRRRGRTTVVVAMNGHRFEALLEPDGQKSHWLRIDARDLESAAADYGRAAKFEISALEQEPEPELPRDFVKALAASSEAQATWDATTTIARIDWIHWIISAKQTVTRAKRITDACEMLASGKKRVCCFDPSGFYSKALSAPEADESAN